MLGNFLGQIHDAKATPPVAYGHKHWHNKQPQIPEMVSYSISISILSR